MRASLSTAMPASVSASASCGLERPISDGRLAAAGRIAVEWSRFSAMLMAWLPRRLTMPEGGGQSHNGADCAKSWTWEGGMRGARTAIPDRQKVQSPRVRPEGDARWVAQQPELMACWAAVAPERE